MSSDLMGNDYEKDSRILVVDDNPQNIQVIGNILRECGYKISIAMNGKEALNFVSKTIPDLILLDIMMPEMDGYETCEKLKQNDATKDIPVIFLSAKVEVDDIVKGFELGGVDYVTKPYKREELLARVKTHLRLRKTERQLLELIGMKDRLFSIIGHDLRGPLGTLMMMMDTFIDPNSRYTEEDMKKYMVMMKDSSKTAYTLLENLLNWARSQQNLVQFSPEKINIPEIIKENIKVLSGSAESKEIKINLEAPDEAHAFCDKNSISTVIRNLISNALKFTQNGGEINIKVTTGNEALKVSVSDSGIGISEENLNKLFKKNLIYSTRGTKGEKGTGLGLLLCKDFVEGNKGEISVESKIGIGTTFHFTIPIEE